MRAETSWLYRSPTVVTWQVRNSGVFVADKLGNRLYRGAATAEAAHWLDDLEFGVNLAAHVQVFRHPILFERVDVGERSERVGRAHPESAHVSRARKMTFLLGGQTMSGQILWFHPRSITATQ